MAISSTNSGSGSGVGSGSFNFDGVVSGLNTTSIINSLMKLDQAPITQLKNQQSKLQSRDTAYQAVEANVTSFQIQGLGPNGVDIGRYGSAFAGTEQWWNGDYIQSQHGLRDLLGVE